jgi:hypothetical protein
MDQDSYSSQAPPTERSIDFQTPKQAVRLKSKPCSKDKKKESMFNNSYLKCYFKIHDAEKKRIE